MSSDVLTFRRGELREPGRRLRDREAEFVFRSGGNAAEPMKDAGSPFRPGIAGLRGDVTNSAISRRDARGVFEFRPALRGP